jgi:rRNA-processing protein FCF1
MRHGRAKAARKTLQYFSRTIGLQAPYWILLDATMVVAMFNQKILPFKERMDRVLQTTGSEGPNKYCVTKAALEELELIYDGLQAKNHEKAETFEQALEFIRNECMVLSHRKEEEEGIIKESEKDKNEKSAEKEQPKISVQDDLLLHMQEYDTPYIVATQDEDLLDTLRSMGTNPIVRLANVSVLILEHQSKQSQNQFKGIERKKWSHSLEDSEKELVKLAKRQTRQAAKKDVPSTLVPQRKGKTKAKGPNPLSCKRKAGNEGKAGKESASKKRRLRSKK